MSAHTSKKKKKTPSGSGSNPGTGSSADSQFIMDDVRKIFADLTSPETNVTFNPAQRADSSSIQNTINPPLIEWTWPDENSLPNGRSAQKVQATDVGKYGLQVNTSALYELVGVEPQNNGICLGTWQ